MPLTNATVVTNAGVAVQAKRMLSATPTQGPPTYIGMGTGATGGGGHTAAVGDVALLAEVGTRTNGTGSTVTGTVANDTYQCVGTCSAGSTITVDEAGLFDASTSGAMFMSATFTGVGLTAGDSIQFTWKNRFVAGP